MISQVLPYIIFQVKISASVVPIVSCIVRIFSRLFPCTFKILSRYLPGISRQKPWKDANKKRFVTAQGGVLASDHRHGDRIANGSLSLASFHPLLPSHHCLFYVWCGYFHGRVYCHKMLSFAWVLLPMLLSCWYWFFFEKQLSTFSFLDFEEAGKWTTQTIDLKRTREEIRPGTCGEREVYNTLFKFALGSTTFKWKLSDCFEWREMGGSNTVCRLVLHETRKLLLLLLLWSCLEGGHPLSIRHWLALLSSF